MSIRAVAQATGVTAPSIYRHFEDKTHLLFEVSARQLTILDEALEDATAGIDDPIEVLPAQGKAYVRFGIEHPEHYRIMFMGPSYATPEQWSDLLATGSFASLMRSIEVAAEAGTLRITVDAFTTALHLWVDIHGLTSLLVTRPSMPWPNIDGFIDTHLTLCLRAHLVAGSEHTFGSDAHR